MDFWPCFRDKETEHKGDSLAHVGSASSRSGKTPLGAWKSNRAEAFSQLLALEDSLRCWLLSPVGPAEKFRKLLSDWNVVSGTPSSCKSQTSAPSLHQDGKCCPFTSHVSKGFLMKLHRNKTSLENHWERFCVRKSKPYENFLVFEQDSVNLVCICESTVCKCLAFHQNPTECCEILTPGGGSEPTTPSLWACVH